MSISRRVRLLIALYMTSLCYKPVRPLSRPTTWKIIETKVFIDVKMYERWFSWIVATTSEKNETQLHSLTQSAIKEYVSLCFLQVNDRLGTLKPALPFTYELRLVAIEFNYTNFDDSQTTDVKEKFEIFRDWYIHIRQSPYIRVYDHVMLLTGDTLTSSSNRSADVKGYTDQIDGCYKDEFIGSIIEDKGGFQCTYEIARQIGYILGALSPRDGSTERCIDTDYNIMAPLLPENGPVTSQWYFSNCSASGISWEHNTHWVDCYANIATPLPEFVKAMTIVPGQKYPANQQCQMMYGVTSHVCLGAPFSSIDEICTSMYCLDPVASKSSPTGIECKKHFAAEGTSCGDGKWCRLGACTSNSSAPIIGNCSLGDNVILGPIDHSCAAMTKKNPASCYSPDVSLGCCASCDKVKRHSTDCPYGDREPGCHYDKTRCSKDMDFLSKCCSTCGAYAVKGLFLESTGRHVMLLLVAYTTLVNIF